MKIRFRTLLVVLMASMSVSAQYIVNSNYDVWFEGSDNEMYTRKAVWCEEDYQDLWNGCYVRISGGKAFIYSGGICILYGDEVNLLYNGYYRAKRGNMWYLFDEDGDIVSGVYGEQILYYPFNYVACKKGYNLWYVYSCDGERLNFYSNESPWICSNGCWIVQQGTMQYGIDQDGDKISGVYGDDVTLVNGRWKCVIGNYVRYVDP